MYFVHFIKAITQIMPIPK